MALRSRSYILILFICLGGVFSARTSTAAVERNRWVAMMVDRWKQKERVLNRGGVPQHLRKKPFDFDRNAVLFVIPTYQRWQPYKEIASGSPFDMEQSGDCPFILAMNLRVLEEQKISHSAVHIWVATKAERFKYQEALRDTRFSSVTGDWSDAKIIVGVEGLALQRAYICRSYPPNVHIVSLDDDVAGLRLAQTRQRKIVCRPAPSNLLKRVVAKAIILMEQEGAGLWGVAPGKNDAYMKPDHVSRKCGLVGGPLFGFLNSHDAAALATTAVAEDQERSILSFAQRGVLLRFMAVRVETRYFAYSGGINAKYKSKKARMKSHGPNINRLARLWPEYGTASENHLGAKFKFKAIGKPPLHIIL